MKKAVWLGGELLLAVAAIVLAVLSRDIVSRAITFTMLAIVLASILFGFLPMNRFLQAMYNGIANIQQAVEKRPNAPWEVIQEQETFFDHKELDVLFQEYMDGVRQQRKYGVLMNDICDVINEDMLSVRCWQGVMQQIPGTLTGLGILGTFLGLILGIQNIRFDDASTAIASIESLLNGVGAAFYTSIVGVILSILFNILDRILWNVTVREIDLFTEMFYRYVIPSADEQLRFRQKREIQEILTRMDQLPNKDDFPKGAAASKETSNDVNLLRQVRDGLKNEEFTFYLQPIFDLNTHKIVGAEVLIRWIHPKMGVVPPNVFMPLIESNGYVTRLDTTLWEQVCKTIRHWIDAGMKVIPLTVNISQTDILALDVTQSFSALLQKYRIPPMYLEVDIAENAYLMTQGAAVETERSLRQMGVRVAVDGFDGSFITLSSVEGLNPDSIKLDVRAVKGDVNAAAGIVRQATQMNRDLVAVGIESMDMVAALRKAGCERGQGYYLAKPLSIESFEKEVNGDNYYEKAKKEKRVSAD